MLIIIHYVIYNENVSKTGVAACMVPGFIISTEQYYLCDGRAFIWLSGPASRYGDGNLPLQSLNLFPLDIFLLNFVITHCNALILILVSYFIRSPKLP